MTKFILKYSSFFTLIAIFLTLNSCNSDRNSDAGKSSDFYLQANFDGQFKKFQYLKSYGGSLAGEGHPTSFDASYLQNKDGTNQYPQVSINIFPDYSTVGDFKPGTYNEDNSSINFEYKTGVTISSASKYAPKDFTYTITEYTDIRIRGTFSGTIQNGDGQKIVVTNGEFFGYRN